MIYYITSSFDVEKVPQDLKLFFNSMPTQTESFKCREEASDLIKISDKLRVKINVYSVRNNEKYKQIIYEQSIGEYNDEIYLLTQRNLWAIIKNPKKLVERFQCHTCGRWIASKTITNFKKDHYSTCRRCACERAYKIGDPHPIHCKEHQSFRKKKKGNSSEILLAKREKEVPYKDHQHFADFECFPQQDLNGKFIVYAAGLSIAGEESIKIDIGQNAMDQFMDKIFNLQGVLWFFNGSKFDTYFIIEWLVINKIPFDQEDTIVCDRQVIQLSLNTKKGKLVIKDLAKFFVGSLAYNCKSFGIDSSDSKGEFDHDKMTNWAKVEEMKDLIYEYLILDVKALRAIYLKSAETVANDFGLLFCKYMSLAQLSYAISTLFIKEKRLYRCNTRNGELEAMQATYYGGRVPVTTPIYVCDTFEDICTEYLKEDYDPSCLDDYWDNIKLCTWDDLFYGDINSLYPSQMYGNLFACGYCNLVENINNNWHERILKELMKEAQNSKDGKFELVGHDETLPPDKQQLKLVWKTTIPLKWSYRMIKVDLICPKNLYIPFIMSRNEKGRNVQNLEDKVGQWITGAEIIEAIILGYQVTKVYCYYVWSKQEYLFQEFIHYNYKKKSEAPRNTSLYEIPKIVMNALSGKHGQRNQVKKTQMYIGEHMNMERITSCNGQFIISEETGELLAVTCESETDPDFSPYSVHLSAQILAWSRVHMSRFTRMMDAYRNPKKVPLEGDTDSLVLPYLAIHEMDQELRKIMFGPHLGQMKDEMPDDVLLCQINIAPKTKFKVYLTKVLVEGPLYPPQGTIVEIIDKKEPIINGQLNIVGWRLFDEVTPIREKKTVIRSFFKSKGIPHARDVYDPFIDYSVSAEKKNEALRISKFIAERKNTKEHYEKVKFKEPLYIRRFIGENVSLEEVNLENREVKVSDRLNWLDLLGILMGWFDIECLFGGMVRNLKDAASIEETGIAPDYLRRSISKKSWWEPGVNRIYDPEKFPFVLTKPKGFI